MEKIWRWIDASARAGKQNEAISENGLTRSELEALNGDDDSSAVMTFAWRNPEKEMARDRLYRPIF